MNPDALPRTAPRQEATDIPLRRDYIGPPGRQIHVLQSIGEAGERVPVVCLHATAYSGRSLAPLVSALGADRRVFALDTPGYGGSDRPDAGWTIKDYASALLDAVREFGFEQVDLFGYHTGATLGLEMTRLEPSAVRRLALIGVPYFPAGKERDAWRRRLAHRTALEEGLGQFQERWDFLVANRPEGMTLKRAFENFVDELRAWPDGWWAHEAAFTYDYDSYLREVTQPVLILNPDNHLLAPSQQAAIRLPNCNVEELPHLSHGIFEMAAGEIACRLRAFLDG